MIYIFKISYFFNCLKERKKAGCLGLSIVIIQYFKGKLSMISARK